MIVVVLLLVLAQFDGMLAGFRAAAGRDGRVDKRDMFRTALVRGAAGGAIVVAINAGLAALLVMTSPDRDATWAEMLRAGTVGAWVFGGFATLTLLAIAMWFSPVPEQRLLATIIVLGPLTLLRPLVIIAGLVLASAWTREPRVWLVAICAGVTMLGLEWALGRRHVDHWRTLL